MARVAAPQLGDAGFLDSIHNITLNGMQIKLQNKEMRMSAELYQLDPEVEIDGITVSLRKKGQGRPMLVLQSLEGWIRDETFSDALARNHEVYLPQHPGFGQSPLPSELRSVDDLAYFYMTMLEDYGLSDVVLVGAGFGGWVAQEMAVRSTERIGALVLVDTLGLRFSSDPTVRDIQDIYVMSQAEIAENLYHDPEANRRDVTKLPDHVLLSIAHSRETMAFLGWKPFMHNPILKRWLRRIDVPTLVVWGASDRFVFPEYGRQVAAAIPNARFELLENAGHYPHIETPDAFVAAVNDFLSGHQPTRKSA